MNRLISLVAVLTLATSSSCTTHNNIDEGFYGRWNVADSLDHILIQENGELTLRQGLQETRWKYVALSDRAIMLDTPEFWTGPFQIRLLGDGRRIQVMYASGRHEHMTKDE